MSENIDERGIPVTEPDQVAATFCPSNPCKLCTGLAANGMTSFAWCKMMNTCAATIDWDKVYGH